MRWSAGDRTFGSGCRARESPIVLWCPPAIWAAFELLRRYGAQSPDRATCFDAIFLSRKSSGRFLALWAALTTLCVCALPTLAVAGLVIYHFRLMRLG